MALRKSGGYRARESLQRIDLGNINNPWNFFSLMMSGDSHVLEWLKECGLLEKEFRCEKCAHMAVWRKRIKNIDGYCFRCKNRHEISIRKNSWFEKSKLTVQDVMLFTKTYLQQHTLLQCANQCGVSYKSTAVDWASFIRELFKEYTHNTIKGMKFSGEVEIDESLFGRKVKYHRGNPNVGVKIWVFGIVERGSNRLLLFPVDNRDSITLTRLILRHVEKGTKVYSDGWSAYCTLNDIGYEHFTVLHKYAFRKEYVETGTGKKIIIHTNTIEGAWKHAKSYFRRMSGTSCKQFEGHLAEVLWRNHVRGRNMLESFFQLLKSVYTLHAPPTYHYTTPLFDSWDGDDDNDDDAAAKIVPELSDVEDDDAVHNQHKNVPSGAAERPISVGCSGGVSMPSSSSMRRLFQGSLTDLETEERSPDTYHFNDLQDILDADPMPQSGKENAIMSHEPLTVNKMSLRSSSSTPKDRGHQKSDTIVAQTRRSLPPHSAIENNEPVAGPSGVEPSKKASRPPMTVKATAHQVTRTSGAKPRTSSTPPPVIRPKQPIAGPSTGHPSKTGKVSTSKGSVKRHSKDNVCCPKGYRECKKDTGKRMRQKGNQYAKAAFVYEWSSSGDDFELSPIKYFVHTTL